MSVGILAFGSILDSPGEELRRAEVERIRGVPTPFLVEFARSSRTRDGAPTLVPVEAGGASVRASIIVLHSSIDEDAARDMLYRREANRIGDEVTYRSAGSPAWIGEVRNFSSLGLCLYSALEPNISPLTVANLATAAIRSAAAPSGRDRRDGISYLKAQLRRRIWTPLMPRYEAEILARTGASDLDDAWARVALGGADHDPR